MQDLRLKKHVVKTLIIATMQQLTTSQDTMPFCLTLQALESFLVRHKSFKCYVLSNGPAAPKFTFCRVDEKQDFEQHTRTNNICHGFLTTIKR